MPPTRRLRVVRVRTAKAPALQDPGTSWGTVLCRRVPSRPGHSLQLCQQPREPRPHSSLPPGRCSCPQQGGAPPPAAASPGRNSDWGAWARAHLVPWGAGYRAEPPGTLRPAPREALGRRVLGEAPQAPRVTRLPLHPAESLRPPGALLLLRGHLPGEPRVHGLLCARDQGPLPGADRVLLQQQKEVLPALG